MEIFRNCIEFECAANKDSVLAGNRHGHPKVGLVQIRARFLCFVYWLRQFDGGWDPEVVKLSLSCADDDCPSISNCAHFGRQFSS